MGTSYQLHFRGFGNRGLADFPEIILII